ncbi:GDSL-type esterase/lipase family protein [Microbacterium oxydans]|uniref:GDSL-type esterase/lipase family protein n=1 Tax=Microbacterium oxydans TaxID=82380 RepID=UPI00142DD9DF|nr:GDSL-type esterase/lipase family protein [Microbacterium oxydans]
MTGKPLAAIAASVAAFAAVVGVVYRRVMYPPLPRPRQDRIRIAAVGDSNTYGAGTLFRGRGRRSYPGRLEQLLGDGYQVLNYGVNRCTLQQEGDWPYDATPQAAASLQAGADIVLVMLGSNDARGDNWNAERYETQLAAFVERYRTRGATVFLLTPPVAFPNRRGVHERIIADEVAPIVRTVASRLGVDLIDVFDVTRRSVTRHPDGIHLDVRASGIVAETVAETLQIPGKSAE